MSRLEKVIRPGSQRIGTRDADVFCKIDYDGTRLSITGVVGPKRNGDALGGCGQITPEVDTLAPGWTAERLAHFAQTWERWHLNDLRAGCEHQRAAWDTTATIEVVTYRLTNATLIEQRRIRERVMADAMTTGAATVTDEERAVLALPWETKHAPDADSTGSGRYEVNKRETKGAGWVYPSEHPQGLLTKPCEVCGYKYGSAWLTEAVPEDVLAFLASLPDTDRTPAWV